MYRKFENYYLCICGMRMEESLSDTGRLHFISLHFILLNTRQMASPSELNHVYTSRTTTVIYGRESPQHT